MKHNRSMAHTISVVSVMSALSVILMILEFSVPLVPSFLKYDFSDLPALITAFAVSPIAGVLVELVKNVVHLPFSHTAGIGELANFLVGAALIFPAGLVYRRGKTKKTALLGAAIGTLTATLISFPVNYWITYPFYAGLFGGMEQILSLYKLILPSADTLTKALVIFNMPFTFIKGAINVAITFLIYKPLSPILHGKGKHSS